MPRNLSQKMFFAFVTVLVTVHAYVFYSLYVIHGGTFIESTEASGVLEAIGRMGGVPVLVMCPIMSFIAAILYYPYQYVEFNIFHFIAEWLKLICFNFPFAFFSQLFFIQPLVRTVFKIVFSKDIKARNDAAKEKEARGEKYETNSESDAIADIYKRVEEIEEELKAKYNRSLQ